MELDIYAPKLRLPLKPNKKKLESEDSNFFRCTYFMRSCRLQPARI